MAGKIQKGMSDKGTLRDPSKTLRLLLAILLGSRSVPLSDMPF